MLFFSARCEWCCLFYYIRILFAIPCWNIPILQLHHFISHSFLLCFASVHFLRPSLHFHILFETLCCFHFIHSTQNMLNKMLKYCVAPFIFRVLPKTFEKSICRFAIIRDGLYIFFHLLLHLECFDSRNSSSWHFVEIEIEIGVALELSCWRWFQLCNGLQIPWNDNIKVNKNVVHARENTILAYHIPHEKLTWPFEREKSLDFILEAQ